MAELKPCPFCGGEADCNNAGFLKNGKPMWATECVSCGVATGFFFFEEEAIEAWNKRTEPERPKGWWVLTAHEENCNYRWNVTAECSECSHSKGEVYAGFFPCFPKDLARETILNCAESVKLDNFCPNCGADMRGESDGNL